MSDEALSAQITTWWNESQDLYGALESIWEENLAYYKGIQTDVQKIYGRFSKAVENRIFMAVETTIPIATSRLPDIVVKPGDDDEQSTLDAQDLQDVLNYHMERVGIQALSERFIRDMIVKRFGVFKLFWDKENDDVGIDRRDPRRIRIPKFGTSVPELAFVIDELELSYDSLVTYFGTEKANKVRDAAPKESVTKVRKKTFNILEVWTNKYVCYKSGEEILDKKLNPYYDFENKEKNFFTSPKKPYVIKSLFETEDSLIGDTDYIQQVKSIQDNMNIRKRQLEDIIAKVANPPLLIDSEVMSEEEAANITNEPGFIFYGKDAATGTKVRFENPGQVPNGIFDDLQISRQTFDNIWGVHSTTRGEREGRETLGGRQLLREGDMGRIDAVARQLERALDEIAEFWTQMIKMFYTEEKSFSILGDDGVRFVKNFNNAKVRKVKPMVKPGSTLKEDEYAIQQKAILLWQNKAIGLKTLYKMLKLPNMQEATDDFVETQSGALLQKGQPGGAAGGLPPELQQQIQGGGGI